MQNLEKYGIKKITDRSILGKYLKGELVLIPVMNILFKNMQTLVKDIDIIKAIEEKLGFKLDKTKIDTILLMVVSGMGLTDAIAAFGTGWKPDDLGEGRASCRFFEISGTTVIVFTDSRGTAIELSAEGDKLDALKKLYLYVIDNPVESVSDFFEIIKKNNKKKSFF